MNELWSMFTYFVAGQMELAGVLGELVTKADQASVSQSLGGNIDQAMSAPKHSLQRKLLDGLRYLIKEELRLNNSGPSDGWLTDEGLWLVSKTVSDKLRAYLLSQGIDGIPSKNSILFTSLQEHHIILSTIEDKAIWSATVTSSCNGWSQSFTFLKVMPSLIWPEEKPSVFDGTVIVYQLTDASTVTETVEETSSQEVQFKSSTQHNDVDSANSSGGMPLADSLDAVFDLLEMNDFTEYTESGDILNGLMVNENNLNEQSVIIESSKQSVHSSQMLTTPDKTILPIVEFTDKEKQTMQQIDEIMPSGEHFIQWLKEAILSRKLIINEPQALVHTVDDTLFIITPGIFMRYVMEFPQTQVIAKTEKIPAWRHMQKAFEKLKYHKRNDDGYSIWTCAIEGPKSTKKVHGYLFNDPTILIPDIVYNNPYLKIIVNINNALPS